MRNRRLFPVLFGGGAAFTPSSLSGLVLWTAARLLPVVADGTTIPALTDFSGTNNQTTNADPAQRAKYYAGVLNGQPVARFTTTDLSRYAFPNAVAGPMTVFIVAKQTAAASKYLLTTGANGVGIRILSTGTWVLLTNAAINSSYKINTAFRIFGTVARAVNDIDLITDGIVENKTTGAGWASVAASIGSYGNSADYFDGDLAELIIYNKALSVSEYAKVGAYLNTIYGLPFA